MRYLNWIIQPLSAFAFGILLLLNILIYIFWYTPGVTNLNHSVDQLGKSLVRSLAFDATTPLYSGNRANISNILNRFADEEPVILAAITSEETDIRLTSRTKGSDEEGRRFNFPISFSNELLGNAELYLSERNLNQWHSQATTSWILFNIMSVLGLAGFIYLKTFKYQKDWNNISDQLAKQLPSLSRQLHGSPEAQIKQLLELLSKPIKDHGIFLKHLNQFGSQGDSERLLEQVELVGEQGRYVDVALVAIQCQNWEQLIREYDAIELQNLWQRYEHLLFQVSELYKGILLPDGFSLAFGLADEDHYAMDAICSARVLQLALTQIANDTTRLKPLFGIAVSAGPAFVSKTHKHGIALPLVTGDAETWLAQLKALQPINQILLAEPILQHVDVNQQIEASIVRDITLRDGQQLEVWELETLKIKDELLNIQAQTLAKSNGI